MSGYTELRELGVAFRPPAKPLPPDAGVSSPFTASWTSTVQLLADELRHLGAERIACELALGESDLRIDGMPRANARLSADAVRLAFDSMYGPLMYETGRFTGVYWRGSQPGWQVNLRAIALGLEALRKVDRYGITKRGEQYSGWKQLPSSTLPEDSIQTVEQASAVITQYAASETLVMGTETAVKSALKRSHPDVAGGSDEAFRKVQRAREVLGV